MTQEQENAQPRSPRNPEFWRKFGVVNAEAVKAALPISRHFDSFELVEFSPDGRFVLVSWPAGAAIVELSGLACELEFSETTLPFAAAFSADGETLVFIADPDARVFEARRVSATATAPARWNVRRVSGADLSEFAEITAIAVDAAAGRFAVAEFDEERADGGERITEFSLESGAPIAEHALGATDGLGYCEKFLIADTGREMTITGANFQQRHDAGPFFVGADSLLFIDTSGVVYSAPRRDLRNWPQCAERLSNDEFPALKIAGERERYAVVLGGALADGSTEASVVVRRGNWERVISRGFGKGSRFDAVWNVGFVRQAAETKQDFAHRAEAARALGEKPEATPEPALQPETTPEIAGQLAASPEQARRPEAHQNVERIVVAAELRPFAWNREPVLVLLCYELPADGPARPIWLLGPTFQATEAHAGAGDAPNDRRSELKRRRASAIANYEDIFGDTISGIVDDTAEPAELTVAFSDGSFALCAENSAGQKYLPNTALENEAVATCTRTLVREFEKGGEVPVSLPSLVEQCVPFVRLLPSLLAEARRLTAEKRRPGSTIVVSHAGIVAAARSFAAMSEAELQALELAQVSLLSAQPAESAPSDGRPRSRLRPRSYVGARGRAAGEMSDSDDDDEVDDSSELRRSPPANEPERPMWLVVLVLLGVFALLLALLRR